MSRNDMWIVGTGGKTSNPVRKFFLGRGEAAILAGEPVKLHTTVAAQQAVGYYPIPLADGQVLQNFYFLGIAAKDSTNTGTADGTVEIYLDLPGTIYSISPKTAGSANTTDKVTGHQFYRTTIDLTSSRFTMDQATDGSSNPFQVIGGDPDNDRFHIVCNDRATWRNWGVSGG